nr:hypothetical protein [Tanacetum cinerariifolium]
MCIVGNHIIHTLETIVCDVVRMVEMRMGSDGKFVTRIGFVRTFVMGMGYDMMAAMVAHSRCGDFLLKEKISLFRRISGSETLSSFPEGNERKVSISKGAEEADQSKDQRETVHNQDEKDQNEKWYCHYSSLRYDQHQNRIIHILEENVKNEKWYCHYSSP